MVTGNRMSRIRRVAAASLLLPTLAASAGQSVLVLDASGSMWGRLDGRTKIELAREAVDGMLQSWPQDETLGLVVYGHRRKGDCTDIETLLAPDNADRDALQAQVRQLTPKGMTPQIDLTITDDFPLAQAIVIISAVPEHSGTE